jgi:uncharacterized protein YjbJ (UPF0337 family)
MTIWMSSMGGRNNLKAKFRSSYGLAKDQAKKDVDTWFRSLP